MSVDNPDHKLDRECFIVRDHNRRALAYVYCEEEPGRRRRRIAGDPPGPEGLQSPKGEVSLRRYPAVARQCDFGPAGSWKRPAMSQPRPWARFGCPGPLPWISRHCKRSSDCLNAIAGLNLGSRASAQSAAPGLNAASRLSATDATALLYGPDYKKLAIFLGTIMLKGAAKNGKGKKR